MAIAKLKVDIGLESNKFFAGMKKADQALKGLISSSFMAKTGVGILAAGLLKASQVAGQFGLNMTNLQTRTGISIDTFRKFAYAGELAGVKTEETMNTLASLQKQMDEFTLTGEGPQWLNELMAETNGDLNKVRDTTYLFSKLQEYATLAGDKVDKMHKRVVLSSFGLSDNMIAALMKGAFNKKAMRGVFTIDKKNFADLTALGSEWNKTLVNIKDLGTKFMSTLAPELQKTLEGFNWMLDRWFQVVQAMEDLKPDFLKSVKNFFNPTKKSIYEADAKRRARGVKSGDVLTDEQIERMGIYYKGHAANSKGEKPALWHSLKPIPKVDYSNQMSVDPKKMQSFGLPKVLNNVASPVMSKSSVITSATDDRRVTINQTNNFTNADDNPQQIAQATTTAVNDSFQAQTTAAMRGLIGTAGGI